MRKGNEREERKRSRGKDEKGSSTLENGMELIISG
jgi:hypothetical protein